MHERLLGEVLRTKDFWAKGYARKTFVGQGLCTKDFWAKGLTATKGNYTCSTGGCPLFPLRVAAR